MDEEGTYRILLDDEWTLEDLYEFSHTYEQVYFFFDAIGQELTEDAHERIVRAFQAFPWRGGYSAVNFYNQLSYSIARRRRLRIVAIQKTSPGFLDLALAVATAHAIAKIVKIIASTIDTANSTYHNVYKDMQERKLLTVKFEREKLQLESEQMDFINSSNRQMAKLLGFSSPARLNAVTKSPFVTLKILFSVFRRVRTLAEYETSGKADLTEEAIPQPPLTARSGQRRRIKPRRRSS